MPNTQPTYQVAIASAKLAARDILRARWIVNLLNELKSFQKSKENLQKDKDAEEKLLAIAEFEVQRAEEQQDPRLPDLEERLKVVQENYNQAMERIEKSEEGWQKLINQKLKEINDVETGELKVSMENLLERSKQLLEQRYSKAFVEGEYDVDVDPNNLPA